jgi:hypothetical protein
MASTNYTITGQNFSIKETATGEYFQDGGMALVQWDLGYDPKYRPLNEWTSSHLTQVSWTAWYVRDYAGVGQGVFGSNGTPIDTAGPLYLFIDFSNASNFTPAMSNQVWMGQITDILTLPGGDKVIDLNSANIRPVVGDIIGNTLVATDFTTWQPAAIPEPSYSALAVVLFAFAVIAKKMTGKKKQQCEA